jgi:hypothetical protein
MTYEERYYPFKWEAARRFADAGDGTGGVFPAKSGRGGCVLLCYSLLSWWRLL